MAQVIRGVIRKGVLLAGLAVSLGLPPQFISNAAEGMLEYQVKAVFLLNFTKFIEWPATAFEQADSPVTICILGTDPFGAMLNRVVEGEVVNGRKVAVQRIKHAPSPKSCQVLFWGKPEGAGTPPSGLGPGVLTVGEGDGFMHEGGMITFIIENRRVRFDVNQTAAEAAGLKISSKLLSVARTVANNPEKGPQK
jgi:hypothetical protein